MTKENRDKEIRKYAIIGLVVVVSIASIGIFLSTTTYLSCYVMSFGVVEGYKQQLISQLEPFEQALIHEGKAEIKDSTPSFDYVQDAGYNYCLSFAPDLPEQINVEFE